MMVDTKSKAYRDAVKATNAIVDFWAARGFHVTAWPPQPVQAGDGDPKSYAIKTDLENGQPARRRKKKIQPSTIKPRPGETVAQYERRQGHKKRLPPSMSPSGGSNATTNYHAECRGRVLAVMGKEPEPIPAIAERVGLSVSTVSGYLTKLAADGSVDRRKEGNRFYWWKV